MDTDNTTTNEPKHNKPKWLRRLERESWQAELIISGAAIYGSLQLPDLLESFQYYLMERQEESVMAIWQMVVLYWAFFVFGLIAVFIFHFVVRALWIGLVGLNSVYPDGFAPNDRMSKDFLDKSRVAYGDVDGFIDRLDRMASGIFGIGFAFAAVILNLGILLSLSILLASWLEGRGFSLTTARWIAFFPLGFAVVLSFISSLLSMSFVREYQWVKRIHFPLTRLMSRIIYPVNTQYIMTTITLITTQAAAKRKRLSFYLNYAIIIIAFVAFMLFVLQSTDAIKRGLSDDLYFRFGGNSPTASVSCGYADCGFEGYLYRSVLSTRYLSKGDPMWVWVPLPQREYSLMMDSCSVAEVNDDLPIAERRLAAQQRVVDCAREYITIYLDDELLVTPPPLRHYRSTSKVGQFGVRYELSEQLPPPGQHVLKVVTRYPNPQEELNDFRTTHINFWVLEK